MLTRATQWRLTHADGRHSDWVSKGEADEQLAQWEQSTGEAVAKETEKVQQAREKFIADTELIIVSVRNPSPFQVDYRKPTLNFPDGTACQFEEGTSETQLQKTVEEAAEEAYPDPRAEGERPQLESRQAWERELRTSAIRSPFPPILSWDHFFPMQAVAESLDQLSEEGWSLVSASEDRGVYSSDIAESRSAPLLVRYLLVREASDDRAR